MNRLCSVLGVFLGLAATLSGAQSGAQQQERPTFKGSVDLVTIDVTVLDGDSRPVPGLTADDFEIKLDGKLQPVRIVSFVEIGPSELAAPAAAPSATVPVPERPVFSNERVPMPDPRLFVFLLDDLSMDPTRGRSLLLSSQRFVKGLPARDYVGFATSSGTQVVNPTTDRATVIDALANAVGSATDPRTIRPGERAGGREPDGGTPDSPVGVAQALAIDRGDLGMLRDVIAMECFNGDRQQVDAQNIMALAAENNCVAAVQREARRTATFTKAVVAQQASVYTSVIDSMRDAPGFKQLVVLTDGLAVEAEVAPLKPVALAAARAGVRISVMVEEPDLNMGDEGRRVMEPGTTAQTDTGMSQRRREDGRLLLNGAATATEMVGGQLYRIIGDPDPFFDRVTRAGSAVYRLGVQALPDTAPGREFAVEAKVKNLRGVTVAANRIAVVPEPEAPKEVIPPTIDEQLSSALRSGEPHFGVPIELGTTIRRAQNAAANPGAAVPLEVVVDVEIPASANGPLMTMYGLVDSTGKMTSGRRELPTPPGGQPFTVSFVLPVASGEYRLRFAAADPAGSLGSIEVPLDAALPMVGPFVSSDVLAAWVDERGQAHLLTLEALPAGTTSLRTSLELYPSDQTPPPGDVLVAWTITKAGETFPEDEREVVAQERNGIRLAGAEFGTDLFEPGTYTIRATVRMGGTVLGTLLKTFQVKPRVI